MGCDLILIPLQPIADEAAYQQQLAVTRDDFRPHLAVLKIGCGTGSTVILQALCVKQWQLTRNLSRLETGSNRGWTRLGAGYPRPGCPG
ncbi:hypothetical protein C7271_17125 [filamentous cyanobacterium CCP5]|nr:hypothetical protein C7271_17125 [filamentous cyanobacterium CCP5]